MGNRISRKEAERLGIGHLWPGRRGGGRAPGMSPPELLYAEWLEARRLVGEIASWEYEPERLRLAPTCTYLPDFKVTLADGSVEYHEVKGAFAREDGVIKLKWAAEAWPDHRFFLCRYRRGRWSVRRVVARPVPDAPAG